MAEAAAKKPDLKPVEDVPAGSIVQKLTTPVQAHGEMVKQLVFRKPTGGDIMGLEDGYPINIDYSSGRIWPNAPVMGKMMSILAGVPPGTIERIDSRDWAAASQKLIHFFLPSGE